MNNLFTAIKLYFEMNKLPVLRIISDKDWKSIGKSSFIEYGGKSKASTASMRVVRWNDNNTCILISSMTFAQPVSKIKRWKKASLSLTKAL